MLDLKTVKNITISEGSVTKITNSSGVVLWEKATGTTAQTPCYYVADNVSDLPQSLYQAEYAQIGIQKFLITDYHWNVNSKAVVEFEINSDTNEFGKYGRILTRRIKITGYLTITCPNITVAGCSIIIGTFI